MSAAMHCMHDVSFMYNSCDSLAALEVFAICHGYMRGAYILS